MNFVFELESYPRIPCMHLCMYIYLFKYLKITETLWSQAQQRMDN